MSPNSEKILSQARRAAMLPVWLGQLATGAKSFRDNPILGNRRLNELGLHANRVKLAHALANARRARLAHLISDADRAAFERDGFVIKPNFLPPALFDALVAQAKAYRGTARETIQGDAVTRRIPFDIAALTGMPAARAALDMPEWRGLVRYVGSADAEPIIYVQTILSHVVDGAPDPQLALHADTFHPSVKAWLFLTDVPEDDGPFTYVPGSHRLTAQRLAWERRVSIEINDGAYADTSDGARLTQRGSFRVDEATLAELDLPPPRACAVPANTLVVADTFGFHARGASARPSVRVEIWAYGRRSPFLPWVGLDMWQIPALGRRRAHWFWSASDMIEAAGGKKNVWRPRQDVSAFDPAA
jgi:hypothetical protein